MHTIDVLIWQEEVVGFALMNGVGDYNFVLDADFFDSLGESEIKKAFRLGQIRSLPYVKDPDNDVPEGDIEDVADAFQLERWYEMNPSLISTHHGAWLIKRLIPLPPDKVRVPA